MEGKTDSIFSQESSCCLNLLQNTSRTRFTRQELTEDLISSIAMKTSDSRVTQNDDTEHFDNKFSDVVTKVTNANVLKTSSARSEKPKNKSEDPVLTSDMSKSYSRKADTKDNIQALSKDLVDIQNILEKKIESQKGLNKSLRKAETECLELKEENMKLKHRIAFLEDQSEYFQRSMKEIQLSLQTTLGYAGFDQCLPRKMEAVDSSLDERCSTATSGVFSDDSDDVESDIYTIRKVSKQVFSNHKKSCGVSNNITGGVSNKMVIGGSSKEPRSLPPIPPPKPARLYLSSFISDLVNK